MGHAHFFVVNEVNAFIASLEARDYHLVSAESGKHYLTYSNVLSGALEKSYHIPLPRFPRTVAQIRVTYRLIQEGKALKKLSSQLKGLNAYYRLTLPIWKTKRQVASLTRRRRRLAIQRFLAQHRELISAYRFPGESSLTEGNALFNLQVASTPRERAICFEFVSAILEAFSPFGIVRGQRQVNKPKMQRDGWIRRFTDTHKKRGWGSAEILREIQKELREGTWNERYKLHYNLAINTIGRIAGIKTTHVHAI